MEIISCKGRGPEFPGGTALPIWEDDDDTHVLGQRSAHCTCHRVHVCSPRGFISRGSGSFLDALRYILPLLNTPVLTNDLSCSCSPGYLLLCFSPYIFVFPFFLPISVVSSKVLEVSWEQPSFPDSPSHTITTISASNKAILLILPNAE